MTPRVETFAKQRDLAVPTTDRSNRSVSELQQECRDRNVDHRAKDRKPTLIEKLRAADLADFSRSKLTPRQQRRIRKKGLA